MQWRYFVMALGALCAVLVAPQWGWIAREQLAMSLAANGRNGRERMVVQASGATELPDANPVRLRYCAMAETNGDLEAQVACAVTNHGPIQNRYILAAHKPNYDMRRHGHDAGLIDLGGLMWRYPWAALPYAAFLRLAVGLLVHIDRPLPSGADAYFPSAEGGPIHRDVCANGPALVVDALQAARQGEIADKNNAFFPMMQAVVHFATGRDRDAYADLDRAASKSRWDDYTTPMAYGLWKLDQVIYGVSDARSRYYALDIQLPSPDDELLRAAKLVAWEALLHEGKSNPDPHKTASQRAQDGIALRARLMRVGVLMRDQSTLATGPLTGSEMVIIAGRSGLVIPGKRYVIPTIGGDDRTTAQAQFGVYLSRLQANDGLEAAWTSQALIGQKSPNLNFEHRMGDSVEFPASTLFYRWLGGLGLLAECTAFILIGGFVALRCYRCRFDNGTPRPLSALAASGSAVAFVMVACVLLLSSQMMGGNPSLVELLMVMLLGGLLLPLAGLRPAMRVLAKSYVLNLLCLLGLIWLLMWQANGAIALITLQNAINKVDFNADLSTYLWQAGTLVSVVLAPPALLASCLAIWSRTRRVPVAVGVMRGFHALTLPILTLLLLGYVALTFSTAHLELQTRLNMEYCLARSDDVTQ